MEKVEEGAPPTPVEIHPANCETHLSIFDADSSSGFFSGDKLT